MTAELPFRCPACSSELILSETYRCSSCKREFAERDGIPVLCAHKPDYWDPTPVKQMQQYLAVMRTQGWTAGVTAMLNDLPERARRRRLRTIVDDTRACWWPLLDLPRDSVILDYGCGLGVISTSLAQRFAHVVACDLTPERLQFARERARSQNLENITFVCAADDLPLPFASGYFDCVILNGVLEWVPDGLPGDPKAVQQAFLREVERILKGSGQLYLAIENRIAYEYFFGEPDNHSNLLYGSLLPRPIANAWSRIRKGKDYRTYTYSMLGYRRLLRAAGFRSERFYSLLPNYRHIEQISGLSDRSEMNIALPLYTGQSKLRQAMMRSAPFKYFASSFGIVASKSSSQSRFVDRLLEHIDAVPGDSNGSNVGKRRCVRNYLISEKGTLILRVERPSGNVIVRLPVTEVARRHAERNAASTREIHADTAVPDEMKGRIPRHLDDGEFEGARYFVETEIPGRSGSGLDSPRARDELVRDAEDFIGRLHGATREEAELTPERYETLIGSRISAIEPLVRGDGFEGALHRIREYLQASLLGENIPSVRYMGDLGLSNLIVDSSGRLRGVIDWDRSQRAGLPLLDVVHLLASRSWGKGGAGKLATSVFLPQRYDAEQSVVLRSYLDRLSIPNKAVRPLLLTWWIYYVCGRLDSYVVFDSGWVRRNVGEVLAYVQESL